MVKFLIGLWLKIKYRFIVGNEEYSKEIAGDIIEFYKYKTPVDIACYIFKRMKYVSDPLWGVMDIQQDLNETIDRGWKGDCDDYAMVAYRLLGELGYDTYLLTLIFDNLSKNHVVCLFKENDNWSFLGTEGYHNNFKYLNSMFNMFEKKADSKIRGYSKDKV